MEPLGLDFCSVLTTRKQPEGRSDFASLLRKGGIRWCSSGVRGSVAELARTAHAKSPLHR
jgi:hypothetical protein